MKCFVLDKPSLPISNKACGSFYLNHIKKIFLLFFFIWLINAVPYWYNINYTSSLAGQGFSRSIIKTFLSTSMGSLIIIFLTINVKKFHIVIVLAILIVWLVTSYAFIVFGDIDLGFIASLVDSNLIEATEYFSSIHIPFFLYLVIPYFFILRETYKIKPNKLINLVIFSLFFLFALPYVLNEFKMNFQKGEKVRIAHITSSLMVRLSSMKLVHNFIEVIEIKKIENRPILPEWSNVSKSESTNEFNYVIIIGESAPRKYFSYYKNRDLSGFTGWSFISNAISPAVNTRDSIPRVLSKNKLSNVNYNLNIIDLANIAGLDTYWFSNQGKLGVHETPISILAKRSKNLVFHNEGTYEAAGSDDKLLIDLEQSLSDRKTGKLIFLHTIGSHPSFCRRARFYSLHIVDFNSNDEKSCFEDTIYNTEIYIEKVNSIMLKNKLNYKVIYFSDHGMTDVSYPPYKTHGVGKLFSHDAVNVPLIFIDSTNKEKGKVINKTYYMRDFVNTFSDWVGVNAKEIDQEKSIYNNNIQQESYIYQGSFLKKL